jgi:hypothetical protein
MAQAGDFEKFPGSQQPAKHWSVTRARRLRVVEAVIAFAVVFSQVGRNSDQLQASTVGTFEIFEFLVCADHHLSGDMYLSLAATADSAMTNTVLLVAR